MKDLEKAFKVVKMVVTVYTVMCFVLFFCSYFFSINMMVLFFLIFLSFPLIIGGTLIYYYVQLKKYRNNVVSKPKRRFKYLDSFYYMKRTRVAGSFEYEYYEVHVIQDIDTERIYAIDTKATNGHLQKFLEDVKLVKGTGIINNWKEVCYGEEGIYWIDQELNDCFYYDGENVIIKYFGIEHKVNVNNELFHRNPEYDVSLLNRATFIMGFAEFNLDED